MLRSKFILSSILFSLACPVIAEQNSSSTTNFDNWTLNCVTTTPEGEKTAKTACEVRTNVVIQDEKTAQQGVAAVIAIGRTPEKALNMAVQLPISAILNVPVKVHAKDKTSDVIGALTYVLCQPQMCLATGELSDANLSTLQKSTTTFSLVYRNQAGQDVNVEVPTNGLNAAVEAMVKQSK